MIEFISDTSRVGRYTYADDIKNLQDLALSMTKIFAGCGNFIISGCEKNSSGSGITEGYVFIDNKVRYVPASNGAFPVAIDGKYAATNELYEDGESAPTKGKYEVEITHNKQSGAIVILSNGTASRLNEAFFQKYAVVHSPSGETQNVTGSLQLTNALSAKSLQATDVIKLVNGTTELLKITADNNNTTIAHEKSKMSFKMTDNKWQFLYDGNEIAYIKNDGTYSFTSTSNITEVIELDEDISIKSLNNRIDSNNNGEVKINDNSTIGTQSYYRNTTIYDGKGGVMGQFVGSNNSILLNAAAKTFVSSSDEAITLQSSKYSNGNSTTYTNLLNFKDSASGLVGKLGFEAGNLVVTSLYKDIVLQAGSNNTKVVGNAEVTNTLTSKNLTVTDTLVVKDSTGKVVTKFQSYNDVASWVNPYTGMGITIGSENGNKCWYFMHNNTPVAWIDITGKASFMDNIEVTQNVSFPRTIECYSLNNRRSASDNDSVVVNDDSTPATGGSNLYYRNFIVYNGKGAGDSSVMLYVNGKDNTVSVPNAIFKAQAITNSGNITTQNLTTTNTITTNSLKVNEDAEVTGNVKGATGIFPNGITLSTASGDGKSYLSPSKLVVHGETHLYGATQVFSSTLNVGGAITGTKITASNDLSVENNAVIKGTLKALGIIESTTDVKVKIGATQTASISDIVKSENQLKNDISAFDGKLTGSIGWHRIGQCIEVVGTISVNEEFTANTDIIFDLPYKPAVYTGVYIPSVKLMSASDNTQFMVNFMVKAGTSKYGVALTGGYTIKKGIYPFHLTYVADTILK